MKKMTALENGQWYIEARQLVAVNCDRITLEIRGLSFKIISRYSW
jgi:hypothetical protein